jgi:hypothetical protein
LDFADIERHRFRDLENEALRETRASVAPDEGGRRAAQMRRLARSDWNIFVLFSNSTFMGGQLTKGPAGRIYIVE